MHIIVLLDTLCSSELASRDQKLKELSEKYSSEHKFRVKTEKQKDKLTIKLVSIIQKSNTQPAIYTHNTTETYRRRFARS